MVTTRTRLSKTRSKLVIAVIIYHAYYYSLSGTSNCSAMATITVSLLNRFVSSTGHRLGLGNFNCQGSFAFPGFSTYRRAARIRSSGGGLFFTFLWRFIRFRFGASTHSAPPRMAVNPATLLTSSSSPSLPCSHLHAPAYPCAFLLCSRMETLACPPLDTLLDGSRTVF